MYFPLMNFPVCMKFFFSGRRFWGWGSGGRLVGEGGGGGGGGGEGGGDAAFSFKHP